ncbi:class D beta-lactamase [Terrarubrum flagellatum]|uniref:class D beta-lactamase n=1 Tax=Terrirubrum flagellatum TaxID=2895980 RepID=UPI00314516A0
MKRVLSAAALWLGLAGAAVAAPVCTLIADAGSGEILSRSGEQCGTPTSPASTFKVALALMGFDSGVLVDANAPAWPYREDYATWNASWKKTTDPTIWMRDSVVWYSQVLTRTLGAEKFRHYVNKFKYGNRDISGNPGRDDGLTRAWLSSSLKITPEQQIIFLTKLWNRQLPVSSEAVDKTFAVMPRFPLADGWKAYGKTGSGFQEGANGGVDRTKQFGWFIGWAIKGDRSILFARLIKDDGPDESPAGVRARDGMLADLPGLLAAH